MKSILLVKKFLGLVEMTSRLVNASFSLPEWQAVKMIFFAPWVAGSFLRLTVQKVIKLLFTGKSMPRERNWSHSLSVHRTTQRLRMDYDTIRFVTGIKEKQHVL